MESVAFIEHFSRVSFIWIWTRSQTAGRLDQFYCKKTSRVSFIWIWIRSQKAGRLDQFHCKRTSRVSFIWIWIRSQTAGSLDQFFCKKPSRVNNCTILKIGNQLANFSTSLLILEIQKFIDSASVSDPYHFDADADPDPDPRIRIRDDGSGTWLWYGSGSEVTFDSVNRIFPIKCYARL